MLEKLGVNDCILPRAFIALGFLLLGLNFGAFCSKKKVCRKSFACLLALHLYPRFQG